MNDEQTIEQVAKLISEYAVKYLTAEHEKLCLKLWKNFSKKRKALGRSKSEAWSAAVIYVIARLNYCEGITQNSIAEYFKISVSSVASKISEIERAVKIRLFDKRYTTEEMKSQNPWNDFMMDSSGLIVHKPRESEFDYSSLSIGEHITLAEELRKERRYDESIEALNTLLVRVEESPKAVEEIGVLLGCMLLEIEKFKLAESALKMSLEINPSNSSARYFLGCTYLDCGKTDGAILQFQKADELSPDNPNILCDLGWALHLKGWNSESLAALKKAAKLDPNNPIILTNLAAVYEAENRIGEAMVCIEEALRNAPEDKGILEIYNNLRRKEDGQNIQVKQIAHDEMQGNLFDGKEKD
ncbi:MAG: tetratricopeptide repeat protein [Bacteroidota bacterium]|nr:tetratricopeptide repeat protein [Bacteroidota bacterium]